jgi:hypothetical protein
MAGCYISVPSIGTLGTLRRAPNVIFGPNLGIVSPEVPERKQRNSNPISVTSPHGLQRGTAAAGHSRIREGQLDGFSIRTAVAVSSMKTNRRRSQAGCYRPSQVTSGRSCSTTHGVLNRSTPDDPIDAKVINPKPGASFKQRVSFLASDISAFLID